MFRIRFSLIIQILAVILIASSNKVNPLALGFPLEATLSPNQPYIYQVTIDNQTFIDSDLLFVIQSPPNDPLQEPFLDIITSDSDIEHCYNSDDEFSGICRLPKSKIHHNMTINASILCYVKCSLTINAFFSNRFRPTFGNSIVFTASKNDGLPVDLEIQIPSDLEYTQIFLYAKIMNFQDVNEGLEMYANIGNQETEQPNKDDYNMYGQSIYWGGRGLFFSKQIVKPGDWIKVFLYLSEGMQVSFQSGFKKENSYSIELGSSYFDFTTPQQGKNYIVNTKNTNINDSIIVLSFLIYAGDPIIQVSFDSNFNHALTSNEYLGTVIYLITEDQRISYNFDGLIYIQINSQWNSDYFLSTSVSQNNYMFIYHDRSYYNELQPNQVFNYFFDEVIYPANNTAIIHTYSIKVDMINGKGTFGVRLCPAPSKDDILIKNCWIDSPDDFNNTNVMASFQELTSYVKSTDTYISIIFQFNVSKCPEMTGSDGYYCLFQIVGLDETKDTIDYTITYNKRDFSALLRQGQLSKDIIYKDEYLYYKLGLSSLQGVDSITVFTTVIEGDILLISSTKQLYPTLDTNTTLLKYSSTNDLFYSRDQIAQNIYIAIYGIQFSEFTIGVIVSRKDSSSNTSIMNQTNNDNSQSTKISLQLDLSQQFTLQQDDEAVTFQISPPRSMNITVQLIQLVGVVSMEIIYSQDVAMTCRNPTVSNAKITCSFTTVVGVNYAVNVRAMRGDTQKFVILYHSQTHCTPYSLNTPLFVQLSSNNSEAECSIFTISKLTNLYVTTSIPILEVLSQSLSMQVCIEGYCIDTQSAHHFQISKADLKNYCQLGENKAHQISCKIQLSYSSLSDQQIHFNVIVEQQGKDISLFDGISQKVNSYDLSSSKGKYFYYHIYDVSTIKIIFSSFVQTNFYLAAHFVEEEQFFKNTSNIYLPSRSSFKNLSQKFNTNLYETIINEFNTNIMTISVDIINKYCEFCLLTVAVYPIGSQKKDLSLFQIQITQQETMLFPGDSKTGYLEKDQIYNYQLQGSQDGSVIYLHDLNKQSNSQQDCFTAQMTDINDNNTISIQSGFTYLQGGSQFTDVYILAIEDVCHYQITYSLIATPLLTMNYNQKYSINLRNYSSAYFIYNHVPNESFRIIDLIETGSCFIFAMPITNQTIQSLIVQNPFDFPFLSTDRIGDFLINSSSSDFCYDCSYFIVVWGNPSVNLELLINDLESSIPLSINGLLSDKIKQIQKQRSYNYYSITAFNITINILYGKMQVVVLDPSLQEIYSSVIQQYTVINVPHYQGTQKQSVDFNSYSTRYLITVRPIQDSSYTIKINKLSITQRIFQGISSDITVNSNKSTILEFLNLSPPSTHGINNNISLLLEVIDVLTNESQPIQIFTQVFLETEEGGQPQKINLNALIKSDNSFNLQIPQYLGTYYINISSIQDLKISVILVKQSLIHLKPSMKAIMSNDGNFQLYSKFQSVMIQVFTCSGEVGIESSSDFLDFSKRGQQANEVLLDQYNIGGHYVISAQAIYGEYFIRVFSHLKNQLDMAYLISYYFYNHNETTPYRLITIPDRQILFSLTPTNINFELNSISIALELSSSIKEVIIEYRLYISHDKNAVSKFANCRLGDVYILMSRPDLNQSIIQFPIQINSLANIIGDNQIYFVGAEVVVQIIPTETADQNYPQYLRIIYEVIQLTRVGAPQIASTSSTSSAKFLVIWFVLPFIIAGVLFYLSIKFCLKKYRGIPNEFIEQIGQSRQKMETEDMSPCSDKVVNVETVPI